MAVWNDLSRDELIRLLEVYAKNWLAHDGCWFLAAEEAYGLEAAIKLDEMSWTRFSPAEARRVQRAFDIPQDGGLPALARALQFRLYAAVNEQEMTWEADGALRYEMIACRVQEARRRKGLADFPCKSVGLIEYTGFAQTIDPRIEVTCLACPPDLVGDQYCAWRFTLASDEQV